MPFEKGLFYLPCPNQVDDMPPSFEGWYNPHQRWNGWYAPLFNEETYDKIVPTMAMKKLILKNQ